MVTSKGGHFASVALQEGLALQQERSMLQFAPNVLQDVTAKEKEQHSVPIVLQANTVNSKDLQQNNSVLYVKQASSVHRELQTALLVLQGRSAKKPTPPLALSVPLASTSLPKGVFTALTVVQASTTLF